MFFLFFLCNLSHSWKTHPPKCVNLHDFFLNPSLILFSFSWMVQSRLKINCQHYNDHSQLPHGFHCRPIIKFYSSFNWNIRTFPILFCCLHYHDNFCWCVRSWNPWESIWKKNRKNSKRWKYWSIRWLGEWSDVAIKNQILFLDCSTIVGSKTHCVGSKTRRVGSKTRSVGRKTFHVVCKRHQVGRKRHHVGRRTHYIPCKFLVPY